MLFEGNNCGAQGEVGNVQAGTWGGLAFKSYSAPPFQPDTPHISTHLSRFQNVGLLMHWNRFRNNVDHRCLLPSKRYILIDVSFSGAAWAFSRQPNNIKIITKWQADHAYNTDDAKTPTQLVYEEQNAANKNAPNGRTVSGWGYEVKPGEKPLKWFKLCLVDIACLEPELQESEQLIEAENQLRCLNISAVDAAADFLQQLWNHTLRSIERELGKATVESLPFRVVVTVPAIWPEHAMQRTQQAAKRAGILKTRACGETKLDLVPEPEAAALATLTEFKGRPGVRAGDVVTICDCGGGTVVSTIELSPLAHH